MERFEDNSRRCTARGATVAPATAAVGSGWRRLQPHRYPVLLCPGGGGGEGAPLVKETVSQKCKKIFYKTNWIDPASPTMILMRCRIIMNNVQKSQAREGNLPLGQKTKTIKQIG